MNDHNSTRPMFPPHDQDRPVIVNPPKPRPWYTDPEVLLSPEFLAFVVVGIVLVGAPTTGAACLTLGLFVIGIFLGHWSAKEEHRRRERRQERP